MGTGFLVFLFSFIVISALVAIELEDTLSSIISLTVFGVLLAIAFAILQAPDVALTQAVVNSGLVTSFFIVAYSRTQKDYIDRPTRRKPRPKSPAEAKHPDEELK